MFKKHLLVLFAFLFTSFCLVAQESNLTRPGTLESFRNTPINQTTTEDVIFMDDFNGDNSIAGLTARGWVVLNEDGGGTSDAWFQPDGTVFPAYEGPDSGFVASNFQGANGFLIDHWLISPEINVNIGDTLSFWHRSPDGSVWHDSIYVRYSTTAGTTPADFDVTWGRYQASTAGWAQWVGTFNHSGTVRFAIQYYHTDGGPTGTHSNYLGIDYLQVVSGPSSGGPLLIENFDYPVGDSLINHGWVNHSGTGSQIEVVAGSLLYPGYLGSGIGNSVKLFHGGGSREDVHRTFAPQDDGAVYASFLISVDSASTTGEYFLHLGPDPIGTTFRLRVFTRSDTVSGFKFGLSKASTSTVAYTTDSYVFGTTYLVVAKYEFVGASDDVVKLYINPDLSQPEPASADLENLDTGSDIIVGSVALRQGFNSGGLTIDGLIIDTVWENLIPVELTSFTAASIGNAVTLIWSTASEVNNSGFEVEKKSAASNWTSLGFVQGNGTTTEAKQYSFIDNNVSAGNYSYRLKQIDFDGTFVYSNSVEVEVSTPSVYELAQNYPNPFNPSTAIKFNIPEAGNVKLIVYNLLGQEVNTLVNEFKSAGSYTINFDATNLTSGVYLYKIEANGFVQTRKMMLIK